MSIVWVSLEKFVWYQSLQVPLEKIALLYVILPLVWVAVADKATVPPVLAIFVVGDLVIFIEVVTQSLLDFLFFLLLIFYNKIRFM